MIGIVVVSHSYQLANAAIALAAEMVGENAPMTANAAGLDEETFGTDAMRVLAAIEEVDSPDGVLVIMDLGSAVLSTEMSLEFLDPAIAKRVHLTSAPLVEGLVAAMVTASTGAAIEDVQREAHAGLRGKQEAIGDSDTSSATGDEGPDTTEGTDTRDDRTGNGILRSDGVTGHNSQPDTTLQDSATNSRPDAEITFTITNAHGLHARPAAVLVGSLREFDARVELEGPSGDTAFADSVTSLGALGINAGDVIVARAWGSHAHKALVKLQELAAEEFGEKLGFTLKKSGKPMSPDVEGQAGDNGSSHNQPTRVIRGRATVLELVDPVAPVNSGDPDAEQEALDSARDRVRVFLKSLASEYPQFAEILNAQTGILDDSKARNQERAAIEHGKSAAEAISEVWDALTAKFTKLGNEYMAARAEDIRSMRRHLLIALAGGEFTIHIPASPLTQARAVGDESGMTRIDSMTQTARGTIVVIPELDAVTAIQLPEETLAVIITNGGLLGHGPIVLRKRNIPLLVGAAQYKGITNGDEFEIDLVSETPVNEGP